MELNIEALMAVVAQPDEDIPRLNYAQWCLQQAEEAVVQQGDYIEAALTYVALDPGASVRVKTQLLSRIRKLERTYGSVWGSWHRMGVEDHSFHRGFVECITTTARHFIDNGEALLARAPIRHLVLTQVTDVIDELFACPQLSTIRSLDLKQCQLNSKDIEYIASSQYLPELRWLSLANNQIDVVGAEILAQSEGLTALNYVNFFGNQVELNEAYSYDNGLVVDAGLPSAGKELELRYGRQPWLHHAATSITDAIPNKMTILPAEQQLAAAS